MSDDFFAPPPGPPVPPAAGQQPVGPGQVPPGGPMPGMPGYSAYQSEQVWAQVRADAGPAVPMSSANVVAGVAALGSVLMLVGAWAPWVKFTVFDFGDSIGGLSRGINGRYVLALGIAALLTAGAAITTGQANVQVRQICAGVLVGIGVIGLGIVIHDWVTISDQVEKLNALTNTFRTEMLQSVGTNGSSDAFLNSFSGFHVTRGWGMWLSGIASSITGLAGAYLFLVKQP